MKRFISVSLFIFISLSLFALDFNVCVYPSDSEISGYVTKYFPTKDFNKELAEKLSEKAISKEILNAGKAIVTAYSSENKDNIKSANKKYESIKKTSVKKEDFTVQIVESSLKPDVTSLISEDKRLLEYFCFQNNADLLIIPYITDLSDFSHYKLYVYDPYTGKLSLVYQYLSQTSGKFTEECVYSLNEYFSETQIQLEEPSSYEKTTVASKLVIDADPACDVYIDGKLAGTTPYTLEEYQIPLLVRLSKEGYTDKVVSVSEATDRIFMKLNQIDENSSALYKEARRKFYVSFGSFLLSFGARAVLQSFLPEENSKVIDWVSKGIIGGAAVNMGYRLYKYFDSAQYVSP